MRIALTGWRATGKDEAGKILTERFGLERRAFGDIIKRMVSQANKTDIGPLATWLRDVRGESEERIEAVMKGWDLVHLWGVDPFVGHGPQKDAITPLLELYGEWMYDAVFAEYFSNLPEKCVNTRLCRVREAVEWRRQGGKLVYVERPGRYPETDWMLNNVKSLFDAGLIDASLVSEGVGDEGKALLADRVMDLVMHFYGQDTDAPTAAAPPANPVTEQASTRARTRARTSRKQATKAVE